jgi:hypothetical protein
MAMAGLFRLLICPLLRACGKLAVPVGVPKKVGLVVFCSQRPLMRRKPLCGGTPTAVAKESASE